jgi:hypothetical protein
MPFDFSITQLLLVVEPVGPRVVAKSPELPFALEEAAKLLAVRFGTPPTDTALSAGVFALPLGKAHVAVVQVAGLAARTLGFRFLILGKPLYNALGDPFAIADRFPPDWTARGELPVVEWPAEPLPPRTVAALQELMKAGDGPFLLGGTQALLDGTRICMKGSDSTETALRTIWQLLPSRTRCELWPATLCYGDELGFDIWAMPEPPARLPPGCLTEEQAKDYREGRYELALQSAIESGDQAEVDRLFARRTSSEMLRLAMLMVGGALLIGIGVKLWSMV